MKISFLWPKAPKYSIQSNSYRLCVCTSKNMINMMNNKYANTHGWLTSYLFHYASTYFGVMARKCLIFFYRVVANFAMFHL